MVRTAKIHVVTVLVECVQRTLGTVTTAVKTGGLEEVVTYNAFKTVPNAAQKTSV